MLLCPTASDPFSTAGLNPLSLGQKIDQPQKTCPSRAQAPSDFRDASHRLHGRRFSLAQGQQRCARSNLCALLRTLRGKTQGVWSSVQILKKWRCDEGCTRVAVRYYVLQCDRACLSGNFLLRLGQPFPVSNLRSCNFISDPGFKKVGDRLYFLTQPAPC